MKKTEYQYPSFSRVNHHLEVDPVYLQKLIHGHQRLEVQGESFYFRRGDKLVLQAYKDGAFYGPQVHCTVGTALCGNGFNFPSDTYIMQIQVTLIIF